MSVSLDSEQRILENASSIVEKVGASDALGTFQKYLQLNLEGKDGIALGDEEPTDLGPKPLGISVCQRLRSRYPGLEKQFDALEKQLRAQVK